MTKQAYLAKCKELLEAAHNRALAKCREYAQAIPDAIDDSEEDSYAIPKCAVTAALNDIANDYRPFSRELKDVVANLANF